MDLNWNWNWNGRCAVLLAVLCFSGIGYNWKRTLYCRLYEGVFCVFYEYGRIDGVISEIGRIDGRMRDIV